MTEGKQSCAVTIGADEHLVSARQMARVCVRACVVCECVEVCEGGCVCMSCDTGGVARSEAVSRPLHPHRHPLPDWLRTPSRP